jgi:pyruvate kinase
MEIVSGGTLGSRKGVNIPGKRPAVSCLTAKDEQDVTFGLEHKVDFIALSFVQSADDVRQLRALMERVKGDKTKFVQVISKIESQGGIDNFDEILAASDGIMIARGDMGIELAAEEVPLVQKEFIRKCNIAGKPVITATQMLDSMERNPTPTRAEVSDVANAVLDSTDAIMLSGETASGKYPIEAIKTMSKIATRVERALREGKIVRPVYHGDVLNVSDAVSMQAGNMAKELGAKVILCITTSGATARNVARFRPDIPIIAASPYGMLQRQLMLIHGVSPFCLRVRETEDVRSLIFDAIDQLKNRQKVQNGDRIVVTVGMKGAAASGGTNLIYVHTVGDAVSDVKIERHEKADTYIGI